MIVSTTPVVSILMPCYGVARYLPDAIRAIQNQSFTDWELLCIDDASPDDVASIVRSASASDSRIRLVRHDVNQGLSAARNTGLRCARGTYVWFPDPDDMYEANLLELAVGALEHDGSDVAVFGCSERFAGMDKAAVEDHDVLPPVSGRLEGDSLHKAVIALEEATLYGYAWNKVYRRSCLEGLYFERIPLIEDIDFNVRVFNAIRACSVIDLPLYFYMKRTGSNLTNKFVPEYYGVHRRRIEMLYEQQRDWGCLDDSVRVRLGCRYVRYILSSLERNCDTRAGMSHGDRLRWCHSLFVDPLFCELVPVAGARGSGTAGLAARVVSMRSAPLLLVLGRFIHIVRCLFSRGYTRLKMQR